MYGWRARIGLLLPVDNAVMEPELQSLGLEGVSFHSARLATDELDRMPEEGVRQARTLKRLGVDIVIYACAETTSAKGVDANHWITESIEAQTGLPALTAMNAMLEALRALQVRKISLVTSYTEAGTRAMESLFQQKGFETVSRVSQHFSVGSRDYREWCETNRQSPTVAYVSARKIVVEGTEAIVLSGTNSRTFEILADLASDANRYVISNNQAILWAALGRLSLPADGTWAGDLKDRPWTPELIGNSAGRVDAFR